MKALAPWAGWIGGIAGWMASDQIGSDLAQQNCARADPPVMLVIGLLGAAIALSGAAISWNAWRRRPDEEIVPARATRRFIAITGVLAAGIFTLAILFQTISSFIIPQCHA